LEKERKNGRKRKGERKMENNKVKFVQIEGKCG
jgi:hypothetical protein